MAAQGFPAPALLRLSGALPPGLLAAPSSLLPFPSACQHWRPYQGSWRLFPNPICTAQERRGWPPACSINNLLGLAPRPPGDVIGPWPNGEVTGFLSLGAPSRVEHETLIPEPVCAPSCCRPARQLMSVLHHLGTGPRWCQTAASLPCCQLPNSLSTFCLPAGFSPGRDVVSR